MRPLLPVRRRGSSLLAWIIGALALVQPVAAQSVQTRKAALVQDAGEYARAYEVPQAEALRRLRAQQDSVPATDAIAERYRDRLAGISVQHRPDYRYLVYLTGAAPVPDMRIRLAGTDVPVTFRVGARATRERVLWALTHHQAAIRAALTSHPSMGIDPRSGELVVIVGNAAVKAAGGAGVLDARLEALTGVPVQIRVLEQTDRNLTLHGGGRLDGVNPADGRRYRCTSGFAVSDGMRTGITTAAHCLDDLAYIDPQRRSTPLGFVRQWVGLSRCADPYRASAGAAADLRRYRAHDCAAD